MYTFNNNIECGDIILVRGAAKTSTMIAKMTSGHFSHAMVYIGNGRFLEAITKVGVQVTSHARITFKDENNVVVLRCIFDDLETKILLKDYIKNNYSAYQGRAYSYIGAVKSITNEKIDRTKGSYFCSHLVASLYSDAGINLLDLPPHKIKPNDLLDSELLVDVTTDVLGLLSEEVLDRMRKKGNSLICIDDKNGNTLSQDALNHQLLLKNIKKYFIRVRLLQPSTCSEILDVLTDPKNSHCSSLLDHRISREYKAIKINEFLRDSSNNSDFDIDIINFKYEVDSYGYDHSRDMYTEYNYQLVQFRLKNLDLKQQLDLMHEIDCKFNFKYTKLKVEYYGLILKMSQDILDYLQNACEYIECKFSDRQRELQEIKLRVVDQAMNC